MVTPSKITTRTKKMTMKTLTAPKKIFYFDHIFMNPYIYFLFNKKIGRVAIVVYILDVWQLRKIDDNHICSRKFNVGL